LISIEIFSYRSIFCGIVFLYWKKTKTPFIEKWVALWGVGYFDAKSAAEQKDKATSAAEEYASSIGDPNSLTDGLADFL
jgi:prepilin signal peptidase PulO-like enzyme (type II secretory pathway)